METAPEKSELTEKAGIEMPLFSRKPSREAALQKIYTDAYQSSLQSILKESSFDFRGSLESWKQTLAQITSGMALLDGSPPKTGQEKSLLASIMDTERQCHDRIGALETRLHNARVSAGTATNSYPSAGPYGSNATNPSVVNVSDSSLSEKKKPQRVAVGSKAPRADQVKSDSALTNSIRPVNNVAVPAQSEERKPALMQPAEIPPKISISNSPALDFTDQFPGQMPKVSEMPYKMYSKKPNLSPVNNAVPARSAPLLASELAAAKQHRQPNSPQLSQKEHEFQQSGIQQLSIQQPRTQQPAHQQPVNQQPVNQPQPVQHRSSLDYPQPTPAIHTHSMLSTLRSKSGIKPRLRGTQQQNVSSSALNVTRTPSPRTSAESVATKEHEDLVKKHAAALTAAKQTAGAQQQSHDRQAALQSQQARNDAALNQFSGFDGAFRTSSEPTSPMVSSPVEQQQQQFSPPPAPNNHPTQISHQAQQAAGKSSQFQVAYEKVSTSTGRTMYRPRVVKTSQPASGQSAPPNNRSVPSNRSTSNQRAARPSNLALADGNVESSKEQNLGEMDEWDRMVQEKIKDLRGVDKDAAQQIVNEVVLKGDKVTWEDIAGLEKAKASLKETVVYPFLRPDLFMGLREPVLGMLLFGPPGTGKTMLARAVATESKSTFFSISASSLTSKYMGESEKLVRALFQLAKALAPSIIFIDEIDSILTQRADSGEHEASRRIKNEFLVQWSDLQAAAAGKASDDAQVRRVLVLGATNLPWAIDEAARRRFVRRQYIPLPEDFTRHVHLQKLLSHQKHGLSEADLEKLVELTDGYSGSDLTALAKDAAMGPLRSLGDALLTTAPDQIRPMGMSDFVDSMRSIRPSVSPEGLRAFEQWADMYGSSGA